MIHPPDDRFELVHRPIDVESLMQHVRGDQD